MQFMQATQRSSQGRPHGGTKRAFAPLEIGPKNQHFLENMKSAAQFPVND